MSDHYRGIWSHSSTNKSLELLSPKYPQGLRGSIGAGVHSQHRHGKWPIEIDYLPVKECDIE